MDELMQLLKTLDKSFEPSAHAEVKYAPEPEEPEEPEEEMTLMEGCCYMPPISDCAEDLCRICISTDSLDSSDVDYYIGTLCHLMMHHLCTVLDACDCFDESTALRECCVALLQNLGTVAPHVGSPDRDLLLQCSIKLAKCCKTLFETPLSCEASFDACVECLKCCLEVLTCLNCEAASAKLTRCLGSLCH